MYRPSKAKQRTSVRSGISTTAEKPKKSKSVPIFRVCVRLRKPPNGCGACPVHDYTSLKNNNTHRIKCAIMNKIFSINQSKLKFAGVWCLDMCADQSETARTAELTHSEFPQWTDERRCHCNITADSDMHLLLSVYLQYETPRCV